MKNGRIAVPSEGEGGINGKRSGHFGHCSVFTLIDVEDGNIKNISTIANVEHSQGGCLVPVNLLQEHKVNSLIVAGIGGRPLVGFNDVGIKVYYEATRTEIKPVVEDLISGKLNEITIDQTCGGGSAHHNNPDDGK